MSGVEAVIGVVASGAGLLTISAQLGQSAMKLKRLYRAAQDAPRKIEQLTFHLETMAIALQQLEEYRQVENSGGSLLSRCIVQCRQSATEIQQVVEKMERWMVRSKQPAGRLYVLFKDREINDLLEDLERSKTALELAFMIYTAADQRGRNEKTMVMLNTHAVALNHLSEQVTSRHTDISNRVPSIFQADTASSQRPCHGYTKDSKGAQRENNAKGPQMTGRSKGGRKRRLSFRLPSWICATIWEIALEKTQYNWSLNLRTCIVTTGDSLIWRVCEDGDLTQFQRLIECGEASPLEVCLHGKYRDTWYTLLEYAALHGRLEVCRYLLSLTTWPDHAAVLNHALDWYSIVRKPADSSDDWYRMFVQSPGFDADLVTTEPRYLWLHYCPSAAVLDLVLQNQLTDIFALGVQDRFEIALQISTHFGTRSSMGPSEILRCIGLPSTSLELSFLKNSRGRTLLHYIGQRLWSLATILDIAQDVFVEWQHLGVSLLRNGSDPSCIALEDNADWVFFKGLDYLQTPFSTYNGHDTTPLMDSIGICSRWQTQYDSREGLNTMQNLIYRWAEMLENAGLDLSRCGAIESEAWDSLGINEHQLPNFNGTWIKQLVYGPKVSDWSLKISQVNSYPLYNLRPPPGTYDDNSLGRPSTIIWEPTDQECNEGPWVFSGSRYLSSSVTDLKTITELVEPFEPLIDLLEKAQDDCRIIVLMQEQAYRMRRRPRTRSHSQPPLLRRRDVEYYRARYSKRHRWFPSFHLCPFDTRWHFGCASLEFSRGNETYLSDGTKWKTCNVRDCVEGKQDRIGAVQNSRRWYDFSFLTSIGDCQDPNESKWWLMVDPSAIRHTGKPDCPQGCGKVHLDKLSAPD